MKEKLLKAIVLVMAAVMVFGMTTMMFSAAEIGDNVPTTTAKPTTTATPTTEKPTTTAAPTTTEKPAETTTANADNSTTASSDTSTTGADTSTTKPEFEYTTLVRPDRPTQKPATQAPTKKPATPTKKPVSPTKRPSGGSAAVVATTLPEELSSEEFTTEYIFDEPTTEYVWTFAEDTTEAEKEESGVNVKKIIIIAVIVVAVVGAGVCLIILGKKQ